jgi:hypothetical protein
MDLLQARKKYRDLSGRHDLVNVDGSDDGMDFFINEGRKFLDRLDENQKSWASYFVLANIGDFIIRFPYCRAIKEVWVATVGDGRWQLEKKSLQDLTEGYLTGLPASRTNGTPLYYAPGITRYIPENTTIADMGDLNGFIEVPSDNAYEYNCILINVPTDKQLMVDVRGLFYSAELVNDSDKNYWSDQHPMLLYMATMRQMEVVLRNPSGVTNWTNSILVELQQLGKDLVDEMVSEVSQMEG